LDLKELSLVDPETHWYYQSKLLPLRKALRRWGSDTRVIVDVGAGSGFFSKALSSLRRDREVICVDPNYSSEYSEDGGRIRFVRAVGETELRDTDALLFIDVLEHVPDDRALLEEYTSAVRPGTLVLMTVPALTSLWSGHDVYLEHFRRYRRSELERVATAVGLEVLHSQYLFGSIFPIAWLVRRLRPNDATTSDMRPVPRLLNVSLKLLLRLEHAAFWNPLFGVSAFVVARVGHRPARTIDDNH
jgi:SAM-dependent methyltransferase